MLFSGPMVRGILDGSKTQTRRIVKFAKKYPDAALQRVFLESGHWRVFSETLPCPYGWPADLSAPADRLWVKETWKNKGHSFPIGWPFEYRATAESDLTPTEGPWKPSIFMPRVASRILLEITDVRVERLQDISEADAIAEGVAHLFTAKEIEQNPRLAASANSWYNYLWHGDSEAPTKYVNQWDYQYSGYKTAAGSYSSLWAKINGPESWHQNPFVWAIAFKRLE